MRVLFATDGFGPARSGERSIARLFDPNEVSIEVLTVEPDPIDEVLPIDAYLELKKLGMKELGAERVAREAARHLEEAGFRTAPTWRKGHPVREILHAAEVGSFDLIVLGASHETWLGNALLGSVSTHVLHEGRSSILLAHRTPSGSGKILFGVDGSRDSTEAVQLAAGVLDPSRCSAEVATVVRHPLPNVAMSPMGPFSAVSMDPETENERIEVARHIAHRSALPLLDRGFALEEAVLVGRAGPQLLKEAENIGADLVVVGSRGRGFVRRTLLGSVGDQIAHHAPAALIHRS